MSKCEVCKDRPAIAVACVPGVPYSAGYCQQCLEADAHPYEILVDNTACIGSWDDCADWWQSMVRTTLEHLKKTEEEFFADVAEAIKCMP